MTATVRETEADIHARVDFELALKRVQGNHGTMPELSFKGVELSRKPDWIKMLCDALNTNDTLTSLDLSESGLTDAELQKLAITLTVASRCPKLRRLNLRGNPGVSVAGETMAQGLCKMRKDFEVIIGPEFDHKASSFGCDKKLVEGLSAWPAEVLKVPDGGNHDFYCPTEIAGEGERIQLERGFQGTNGTKYWCDLAEFQLYHQTGNFVLIKLKGDKSEGVEV